MKIGANFIQALFDIFTSDQYSFAEMKKQEDMVYNVFAGASKSDTFTVNITTLNNAVNLAYFNMGSLFDFAVDACSTFETTIASSSD